MYLQRLKTKYKEILQSSRIEEEKEDNEDEQILPTSKNLSKLRVLTQYNEKVNKENTISTSSNYILALKQRVAQAMHNFHLKDNEVTALKAEIVRKNEQIRMLQSQLSDGKMSMEGAEKKLIDAKVVSSNLEKEIEKFKQKIDALNLEKDLIYKQSEFYKHQNNRLIKQKNNQQKTIDSFQKIVKEKDQAKAENSYLREDIKRMQAIVNQMCQKRLATDVTDKHYLGKPLKESAMWFSQNLVGEVECFLKKEQIGLGNKRFTNNLVKFIAKYCSTGSKRKCGSALNSRVKSIGKSSHCRSSSVCDPGHSTSMCDMGTSASKKAQSFGMSALKKSLLINKYKKIDSRKYTYDSFYITEGNQANPCEQILKEYRKVLKEVLEQKDVRSSTILNLTDEMSATILNWLQDSIC